MIFFRTYLQVRTTASRKVCSRASRSFVPPFYESLSREIFKLVELLFIQS
jgi:hypothetical protein